MAQPAEPGPPATVMRGAAMGDDARALEELFRTYYAAVVGVASRVLGDRARAEDVAQEVFLGLVERRTGQPPPGRGWLYAAAAHRALNVLRGERRRGSREEGLFRRDGAPGLAEDPAVVTARRRQRAVVRAALLRLPERQAAILVLRHSGLRYAEVGQALGISPASVGTLLRRAEQAMRKELGDDASE